MKDELFIVICGNDNIGAIKKQPKINFIRNIIRNVCGAGIKQPQFDMSSEAYCPAEE
jgi:hypothetical protein